MAGSPDLFVVCKNCGSEVSPYITECPYCGQRLRKRAPKIERASGGGGGKPPKPPKPPRQRRMRRPSLPSLRPGEMPGLGGDETRRPLATIVLVVLGVFGSLVLAFLGRADVALFGTVDGEWWRVATSPVVYANVWYQLPTLLCIGLFGVLLERRHGPALVLALFVVAGMGSIALVAAVEPSPLALGGNGAALGLLAAWVVPVLRARRAGADPDDDDADLLGTFVLAALVAAMPIATPDADVLAGAAGAVVGTLTGLVLARTRPRS